MIDNDYYDLHVIIRGVNKQNLGVYKSFISLRPKAEVRSEINAFFTEAKPK